MDMEVVLSREEAISLAINALYNYFTENGSPLPDYALKGVSMTHVSETGMTLNFTFEKGENA